MLLGAPCPAQECAWSDDTLGNSLLDALAIEWHSSTRLNRNEASLANGFYEMPALMSHSEAMKLSS